MVPAVIEGIYNVVTAVKDFFAAAGNLFIQVPDMLMNLRTAAGLVPEIVAEAAAFAIVVRLIVILKNKNAGD